MRFTPREKALIMDALGALCMTAPRDEWEEISKLAEKAVAWLDEPVPFEIDGYPLEGSVLGVCGHRVAEIEWVAGFRNCENCRG